MVRGSDPSPDVPYRFVARDGVVRSESHPSPLGPDDVRVRIEAAALGSFPPVVERGDELLGDGFVGRIVAAGESVPHERLDTRVVGILRAGSAASELTLHASGVFPADESSPAEVAALTLASGLTALSIDWTRPVGPGETALVLDLTGSACCLLAGLIRRRGGNAIAWRTTADGVDDARRAGYTTVFVSPDPPRPDQIVAATGGRLADFVVDASHTDHAPWALVDSLLDPAGYALRWQDSTVTDWDPQRSRKLATFTEAARHLGGPGVDFMAALDRGLRDLGAAWTSGELFAPVRVFGSDRAQDAYDAMGDPHGLGRVVIRF